MSFWSDPHHALTLFELLLRGELPRREEQKHAWTVLMELGWARRTRRVDVLALDPSARAEVEETLTGAMQDWRALAGRLSSLGLPCTPTGLRELKRRDRLEAVADLNLPERMNRRTAAAMVARHSKASIGPFEQVVLEEIDLTDDGLVRMRPNAGLEIYRQAVRHDARDLSALLGELVLTDRALRDGTRLGGRMPRAVLTVENLGAYLDVVVQDDVLVVHIPGWNTRTAKDLMGRLDDIPILHFGDLDPNGIMIVAHLRHWRPAVRWLVPAFWETYTEGKGLKRQWPELQMPSDTPAWVVALPERRLWLEQEVIVTDPRLEQAVEAEIRRALDR